MRYAALPIVLKRTWLGEGDSVTSDDGSCLIHADYIGSSEVRLSLTVGSEKPQTVMEPSGTRTAIKSEAAVYYIDVHEIHEKQVGIQVTRESISKPPPR